MLPATELIARVADLRTKVRTHKTELGRQRRALQSASDALQTLEAECRRRGIRLIVHPTTHTGEGDQSSWPVAHPPHS